MIVDTGSAAPPAWFTGALAAPVAQRTTTVEGVPIAYREWGEERGGPAGRGIVLVHGGAVGKGRSGQVLTVLGTVLFTALAGVVFCEVRRRSGSVLASVGLHWAVNALSVLASAAVWAWGT